jgi:hypothetical protein
VDEPSDRFLERIRGNRTFFQRTNHAVFQLRFVKRLATVVAFDQSRHYQLGTFESRETLIAIQALATTPNLSTFPGEAGIDYFGFFVTTKGTVHAALPQHLEVSE